MSTLPGALPSLGQSYHPETSSPDRVQLAAEATRARMAEIHQETSGNTQSPSRRSDDRPTRTYRDYRDPDRAPSERQVLNYDDYEDEEMELEPEHLPVPAFSRFQTAVPPPHEVRPTRQQLINFWVARGDEFFEVLPELGLSSEDIQAITQAIMQRKRREREEREKESSTTDTMAVDPNDPLGLGLGGEFTPKKDGEADGGDNPSAGAEFDLLD
jgi:hypothetical protein